MAELPRPGGHLFLGPRKKWHHDQRNTRQDESRNAVLGSFSTDEIGNRLVTDIKGEGQEAEANDPQTELLVPFPLQRTTSTDILQSSAVPEVTSMKLSIPNPTREMLPASLRDDRDQSLQSVPTNREIL
jgi:hypothetical protein